MLRRGFTLLAIVSLILFAALAGLCQRQHSVPLHRDQTLGIQLDRQLPVLWFDGASLADVIDFLADVSGANIDVNWRALRAAGINPEQPINLELNHEKYSIAFAGILDSAGLAYTVDHSTICISTRQDLKRVGTAYRPGWPWPAEDDRMALRRPDPREQLPIYDRQQSGETTLQSALEQISRGGRLAMVVRWEELRRKGVTPETVVDARPRVRSALSLDDVLRHADLHDTLQYQMRDGVVTIASSDFFDRQERPLRRAALAVAILIGIVWLFLRFAILRRPRARQVFRVVSILLVTCATGAAVWLLQTTQLQAVAFDRRFTFGQSDPGVLRFSAQPVALPYGPAWRETARAGPRKLFSRFGLNIERTGELNSELRANAPTPAVAGLLILFPALWTAHRVARSVRKSHFLSAGRCQVCGYDLRASRNQCPECGMTIVRNTTDRGFSAA